MTYKYFNNSMLAFGLNITNSFKSLAKQVDDLTERVGDNIAEILDANGQYIYKNYKAPIPTQTDKPCRTQEIFDILNIIPFSGTISYESNIFSVDFMLYNDKTDKISVIRGEKDMTNISNPKGYILFTESLDNNFETPKAIQFVEEVGYLDEDKVLFEYRIEKEDGIINLNNLHRCIQELYYPGCYHTHYKDMQVISSDGIATGYQAIYPRMSTSTPEGGAMINLDDGTKNIKIYKLQPSNGQKYMAGTVMYCHPTERVHFDSKGTGSYLRFKYISGRRSR